MAKYDPTTANNKCIFCEIVAGRLSVDLVFWQDENFMASLAIDPNTKGFTCVYPKKHFGSDVLKMPDQDLQGFILAAKKVAAILEDYFSDVGRVGLIMEGTGVDHAHIKLVPMHGTEDLKKGPWHQYLNEKDVWLPRYKGFISSAGGPLAEKEKLAELAQKLKKFS